MRLLDATGDKEGLFAITFLTQPTYDLPHVLAVLVLLVLQLRGTVSRLGLSSRLGGQGLEMIFPVLSVLAILDRTVLLLKCLAGLDYQRQFCILKHDLFVPGDLTVLVPGRMENLAYAGCPIPVLLQALWQRNGTGASFADIERIAENAR